MVNLEKSNPLATDWKQELAVAFKDYQKLFDFLELDQDLKDQYSSMANRQFNLLVSRQWAEQISKGDVNDPLFLQIFPDLNEESMGAASPKSGDSKDAVGDLKSALNSNVINKYQNRALVISTGACAIHCRYCFRRHYPYNEGEKTLHNWLKQLDAIKEYPEIEEVILSGGDPLMLDNEWLSHFVDKIKDMAQIKKIRIHSRIPSVLSSRIDEGFLEIFNRIDIPKVLVWHVNHRNELSSITKETAKILRRSDWLLLNQSVLLKGVNDSAVVLKALSDELVNQGILPYYISQLDEIDNVMHFKVEVEKGKSIMSELAKISSGYGVPKYIQEIYGANSKTIIDYN